jgi:hypothetical protein
LTQLLIAGDRLTDDTELLRWAYLTLHLTVGVQAAQPVLGSSTHIRDSLLREFFDIVGYLSGVTVT